MVDPPHSAPDPSRLRAGRAPAEPAQSTIFDLIECDPEYFVALSSVATPSPADLAAERLRLVARLR